MLVCAALFGAPAARAVDTGDIVITNVRGEVQVTMKGTERAVRAGTVLELPATVRTGRDGAVDLRQGATSVSVGPDTLLEFPALEQPGGPIDRIVQPRGNAFYSIGKRPGRKLRVETPFLVGVVKGTQFNVAAGADSTTISLFEGLLEIRASDDSSMVDIKAGEIATRGLADPSIDVLRMDPGKVPPPHAPQGSRSGDERPRDSQAGTTSPGTRAPRAVPAARDVVPVVGDDPVFPSNTPRLNAPVVVDLVTDTNPNAGVGVEVRDAVEVAPAMDTGNVAAAGVGAADVSVGTDVGAGPVSIAVDVSTDVDPGAGKVDAGGASAITSGPVAIDTTLGAGVDLGGGAASVDVGTPATVDVGGGAAAELGAGAAVDVGAGVPAAVDGNAGVGTGPVSVEVGAGADLDLAPGNGNAASVDVNAGANAGPLATDAGAGVAVELGGTGSPASVDLGVSVGGADLNVGVDLGLDVNVDQGQDDQGNNSGKGNVVNDVTDTVDGVLDGLLRKPGKK